MSILSDEAIADTGLHKTRRAVEALQAGRLVIILEANGKQIRSYLALAAETASAAAINFMTISGGLLCVAMTPSRFEELRIPIIEGYNVSDHDSYGVSIRLQASSGMSASERARTLQALSDPKELPSSFSRPGHVFPIRTSGGGVLGRLAGAEAAVDVCTIGELSPVAALCVLLNQDGEQAQLAEVSSFARKHQIPIVTADDIASYRLRNEKLVVRFAETTIPIEGMRFRAIAYTSKLDDNDYLALIHGSTDYPDDILVYLHKQCVLGDVFGSQRCSCADELSTVIHLIRAAETGIIVYVSEHGSRGNSLIDALGIYQSEDRNLSNDRSEIRHRTLTPAERGRGAQVIVDLGIRSARIIAREPVSLEDFYGFGLESVEGVDLGDLSLFDADGLPAEKRRTRAATVRADSRKGLQHSPYSSASIE